MTPNEQSTAPKADQKNASSPMSANPADKKPGATDSSSTSPIKPKVDEKKDDRSQDQSK